jgi:hypothetical protein
MSVNRLWAAPKLSRLLFNQLAVSGRTVAVPSDQLGRPRARRQLRDTRRELSMMVSLRQTRGKPSAGRRCRARRTRVLGGRLLAEGHHEGAIGVVVGARPLLNHGLREAEGLRTDRPALRVARSPCGTSTGPGLNISGRRDALENRITASR